MQAKITLTAKDRPPFAFRVADWMMRHDVKGGYRLWRLLLRSGHLTGTVRYRIAGAQRTTDLFVPLGRPESSVGEGFVRTYEQDLVRAIAEAANSAAAPTLVVDCGADIGLVSTALMREIARLDELVAFEPNELAFSYLDATLSAASVKARAIAAAVGASRGRGRLAAPAHSDDAHSLFVASDPSGPLEITPIDDVLSADGRFVALKIDVEGEERQVVEGARRLLSEAPAFVVVFEANRTVCEGRGEEPCDTIRRLMEIRLVDASIAELPSVQVDPDRPFFEQVAGVIPSTGRPIYNIVVRSRLAAG